ncbi:MAG: hypothetical protein WDA04_03755, partial [Anaerolineaceae bacterium]
MGVTNRTIVDLICSAFTTPSVRFWVVVDIDILERVNFFQQSSFYFFSNFMSLVHADISTNKYGQIHDQILAETVSADDL